MMAHLSCRLMSGFPDAAGLVLRVSTTRNVTCAAAEPSTPGCSMALRLQLTPKVPSASRLLHSPMVLGASDR